MNTRPRTTILVVEDNAPLRRQISQILAMQDYRVIEATDGREALARLDLVRPDLILCDIAMPELDGHEVLRSVRATPTLAGLPFVFLTAKVEKADQRAGMNLGADDYLTKPFAADELLATVRTRLERQRGQLQAQEGAADRVREDLLLALPHELRTPLNGILGAAELLAGVENMEDSARRELAELVVEAGERLERTSTNLFLHLQITRARRDSTESHEFSPQGECSVTEIVRLAAARATHQRRRLIEVEAAGAEASVGRIDGRILGKIVDELLDNACKFSPKTTAVTVRIIRVGDSWEIVIEDAGPGMSEEQIARVGAFRQFERALREQQGLGLGLSIVENLAQLNQATLRIERSASFGGTRVCLMVEAESGAAA